MQSYNFVCGFYGSESRFLTLKEEHELEVLDSRGLWRIFVLNRGEIKGNLRKLNNKKLHNLYSSWRIRWAGHVEFLLEEWNAHRAFVRKPDEKTPIGIIFQKHDGVSWKGKNGSFHISFYSFLKPSHSSAVYSVRSRRSC
jgi:hypothetical protein